MKKKSNNQTSYASAERLGEREIKVQNTQVSSQPIVRTILDAVPEAVLVLNGQRQIVFINKASLKTLNLQQWELVSGLRPGEALNCDNARKSEGGCGTTSFCKHCGAVNAILASQKGETVTEECRINEAETGAALDLKVKAAPVEFEGETYTVFSILDISDEKRREVLERIFFHDILNTAGGLSGYSELLKMTDEHSEKGEYEEIIYGLSQKIIQEISTQRELLAAEKGELKPEMDTVDALQVLNDVVTTYQQHEVRQDRTLILSPNSESLLFKTDRGLISRILGNLIKNALEASEKKGLVTVCVKRVKDQVEFFVHNQTLMPEEVQMQIFKRSFSTKGQGRGLGTYSIKLLTERYLKGEVRFETNAFTGTTFYVTYPLNLP